MAHGQPNPPAFFVKGQSPYNVANFCATLNWLISCAKELKANAGISITGLLDGAPRIGLKLEEGNGIKIESTPKGSKKISLDGGSADITVNVNGSDYDGVNYIVLESASDSAVTFSATQDGGELTLKIGVHYVG